MAPDVTTQNVASHMHLGLFSFLRGIKKKKKGIPRELIGPENAHLKPDLGVLSHHEMTLALNTHTPLLTS